MNYNLHVVVLSALVSACICIEEKCPSIKIKSPCKFSEYDYPGCNIFCDGGANGTDVKAIFTELAAKLPADKKHFNVFRLHDSGITELPANAFAGIQFNTIMIVSHKLQRIHRQAFNGTHNTTNDLHFTYAPVSERVDQEWDLFGAIRTLNALDLLYFDTTNITSLPSDAFTGNPQLEWLWFFRTPIKTIATHALNKLPKLRDLHFFQCPIQSVAERAFTVGTGGDTQTITFDFKEIALSDTSFADRAFDGMNCTVSLSLNGDGVKHLKREVFEGLLKDNPKNTISDPEIDCNDSQNQWIKEKYPSVWKNLRCNAFAKHFN